MIANCVMDGKGFEIAQEDYDVIVANTAEGAVPNLCCSDVCSEEYDINCLDWTEDKRDGMGIRPY